MLSIVALASACNAADQDTMLRSTDVPYSATISLRDAGRDIDGRRLISYRINLASAKCEDLVIAGHAKFYAMTDGMQVDSTFLPNGQVVKTSIFKDYGKNGEIDITMDVESARPQYAGVLINHSPAVNGACFKINEVSYDFYSRPPRRR